MPLNNQIIVPKYVTGSSQYQETVLTPLEISAVGTTGNQTISGAKIFRYDTNQTFRVNNKNNDSSQGYININEYNAQWGYGSNSIYSDYFGNTINGFLFLNNDLISNRDLYGNYLYINGIFDQEDSSSILEMHSGSIVLKPNAAGGIGYVSIEPPYPQYSPFVELRVQGNAYARNLVYNTGTQTISGEKTFASRPTVNGTGVLLSGEASAVTLPTTILYTTGNQIKSGRLIIGDDATSIVDPNSTYTLSLQTNSPRTWLEILNNSGANKGVFFGIEGNDFEQYNWQGGDIKFFTSQNPSAGTERLRITKSGNVGIGTNSPSEKLEVAGNIIANNLVYKTGNQTINGNKDFYGEEILFSGLNVIFADNTGVSYGNWQFSNRPTVNGTGVLLIGEASAGTISNVVYTTGDQTISGIKTFVDDTVFRYRISVGDNIAVTTPVIQIYDEAGSGYNQILWGNNYLNFYNYSGGNGRYLAYDFSADKDNTLQTIAVDSRVVHNFGNETISGVKTFNDNVYIKNLYVTGTQTVVSTNNFSVQSPYLLLNLTGGAVDGGIFFVTGSGLTGINDMGPIIGFDHSKNFKFGISTRNSDLSTLPDIASVQDIQAYSGFATGRYATITNLATTGLTLDTKINSLSGTLTGGYATITNLATTGLTLDTKINSLSGYVTGVTGTFGASVNVLNTYAVLTTGDQTISGVKTFVNQITASSGANIYFSGFTGSSVSGSHIGILISGVWNNTGQTYTGIRYNITLDSGASGLVPNTTNSLLNLAVNNTGVFNVNSKGQVLINQLGNALSENTLDIRRGGTSIATLKDDGSFGALVTVGAGGSLGSPALVMTSNTVRVASNCNFGWTSSSTDALNGTQDLFLNRDAANIMAQRNGLSAQQFRVYNATGTNSGEFGKIGWSGNVLQIGTEKGGSGIARALEFQTDGTTRMTIATGGQATISNGALGTQLTVGSNVGNNNIQAISFGGLTNIGSRINFADFEIYNGTTPSLSNAYFSWRASRHWCASGVVIGWGAGATMQNDTPVFDLGLSRSATGVLAIGSGTSANASGSIKALNAEFAGIIQFGGTTNAFPSIRRNSADIQIRLADNSAYSTMDAQLRLQGTAPTTPTGSGTAGDMRYDNNYIYICTATNTWKRTPITGGW
jgi:hypothetical protein